MELKVWVDGVVRVVCGLSLETSCQDVVIALAQAIGQTGRYILILKLRDTERHLTADDCPLKSLAQLGQQAADVQFILRRTGPSLSDGPNGSNTDTALPLLKHAEPKNSKHREPQKALTFNLGHLTAPKRTRENRAWSPSPRASPEPRASPIPFLDPYNPAKLPSSYPSKEEVFRQVLQQQEKLRDLEAQLEALERETDVWQWRTSSTPTTGLTPGLEEELEVLELRLRQNEAELMHGEYWEEQLQAEMDKEQDMCRHLDQISSSLDNHNHRLQDLHAHSAHLGQNIRLESQRQSSRPGTPQPEEALGPLKEELHSRWQQGAELDASLTETERELQTTEARLQERCEMVEELNKELRQCKLQQFIQQTGVSPAQSHTDLPQHELSHSLPVATNYLCIAGILDEELTDTVIAC